jgi:hypothetical protein
MTDELEWILKDAIVVIEILSRHLPGKTEKNHDNPQSG